VTGERLRVRTTDGRDAVVLVNASPLLDADGSLGGTVLVLDDITAISELERGRRELFSMANHDLRNPLAGIVAAVQLARRHMGIPERLNIDLGRIEHQSERMLRLTRDLLDVVRFESGEIPVQQREEDLAEHVRAAVDRQEDAQIDLRLPTDPVRIPFDPDRIDQVIDNLLANALRHTAAGTRVEVTIVVEDDEVRLRVRDRGVGIPPDDRARLFAAFYQTPRGRSYGGTGLGLHISRRIAEAHGGRLFLEESGPSGSTFTLALKRRDVVIAPTPRQSGSL
jgi:signal transduction histidine kinase